MNVNEAVARILKLEGTEWISCLSPNQLLRSFQLRGFWRAWPWPILFAREGTVSNITDLVDL